MTSFGNALVHGTVKHMQENGIAGLLSGMFSITSAGITAAIVFACLTALIFKPKG
ncbi:SpoVA/SpoVAEb family sporulation membrane protein [Pseudonocardia charpentierae]